MIENGDETIGITNKVFDKEADSWWQPEPASCYAKDYIRFRLTGMGEP